MQNSQSSESSENDGDTRIYENRTRKTRDINKTFAANNNIPQDDHTGECPFAVAIENQTTSQSTSQAELNSQLDAARRVLETLDEQINCLDKLQRRRQQKNQRLGSSGSYSFSAANITYDYSRQLTREHHDQNHQRALARATEARKLALDYYVEHSLKDNNNDRNTGEECGCHFEHHHESSAGDESGCVAGYLCVSQNGGESEARQPTDLSEKTNCTNLFDYIEQQYQLKKLSSSSDRRRDIQQQNLRRQGSLILSHYIDNNEDRQLFIDNDDRTTNSIDGREFGIESDSATGTESDLVPQGQRATKLGSRRQNSGADLNYSHPRSRLTSEASSSEDELSCCLEIGNALVESCDSLSNCSSLIEDNEGDAADEPGLKAEESDETLSSLSCDKSILHFIGSSGAQLSSSAAECSLTDNNNNNSSSSSLSLSWSQDFLQTFNPSDNDEQAEDELINSLLARSRSAEGNIDSFSFADFRESEISKRQEAPTTTTTRDCRHCNGGSNSAHELKCCKQQQQQQQQRRHSTGGTLGKQLKHSEGRSRKRIRHNSSDFISGAAAAAAAAELDSQRQPITNLQRQATDARGERPASFELFLSNNNDNKSRFKRLSIARRRNSHSGRRNVVAGHHEAALAAKQSMRAVRDIAKMSVPSLSALQYLPGQIDCQLAKSKPTKNMAENHEAEDRETKNRMPKAIEETSSEKGHDESCLFHRLCMCSCVARHPAGQLESAQVEAEELDLTRDSAAAREKDYSSEKTHRSPQKSKKFSKNQRQIRSKSGGSLSPMCVSPTNSSCGEQQQQRDERSLSKLGGEKQSPRFLNLLLLRPSSPSKRQKAAAEALASNRQQLSSANTSESAAKFSGSAAVSGLRLGSDGNLVQSRASSTLDEDFLSEEIESGSSKSLNVPRSPSSSLSSTSAAALDSQQQRQRRQRQEEDNTTRSKSACSTRPEDERDESTKTKTAAYRRFLSPRRIFGSPSSSSRNTTRVKSAGGLESLVEKELDSKKHQDEAAEEEEEEEKETRPKSRSSFLSRSLTKLTSQRSARALLEKKPKKELTQEDDLQQQPSSSIVSDCQLSTTISLNDSSCSLLSSPSSASPSVSSQHPNEGHHQVASKHLTSVAPEIVLDTVEFSRPRGANDGDDHLIAATPTMTRIKNGTRQPQRVNSSTRQLATLGGGDGGISEDGRALSLPASPGRYRRAAATGGASTSPRLRESPVLFRSPAARQTKIEDGLKVCSTEHFEKHIDNVKGNQDDAQAKLFKAWINHFHPNLIQHDLVDELRDGIKLIGLLASLTGDKQLRSIYDKLNNDKQSYVNRLITTPSSRLRHLSNVSIAIDYLRQKRLMKLVNLNPMDIVSGKPNVILGLCWNIILNFQLEQSGGGSLLASADYNMSLRGAHTTPSCCTSRLSAPSNSETNEDGSNKQQQQQLRKPKVNTTTSKPLRSSTTSAASSLIEEYGTNDLIAAKRKLLEQINHRFQLKLTNLTSNLLDGDVLLVIIKRLVPQIKDIDSLGGGGSSSGEQQQCWNKMTNEAKLDCCFDMAETHLGIPRLFDGADLNKCAQADGTKSSLIYLSMLLNAEQQITVGSNQQETSASATEQTPAIDRLSRIEGYLGEIDQLKDKFEIGQLDSTLKKIRTLDKLANEDVARRDNNNVDREKQILDRCRRLQEEADQIEALIKWINEADNLLESNQQQRQQQQQQQRSSKDLVESIERYKQFFSVDNLPKLETSLCPTLERQYRECLSLAKQRVLSMEQTLKNWISYEEARKRLKQWLVTSEAKLSSALNPLPSTVLEQLTEKPPLAQHSDRLNDLIEYFELEEVDDYLQQQQQFAFATEQMPFSSSMDHLQDSVSISGSLISLGSTSSRMSSTLQGSKKASYHKLFDDFELKCRLLAAMLDREQRESLLLCVKELRCRLRYITEQKVPQVITELRMSISRCEMSILEDEEHEDCETESPAIPAFDASSPSEAKSITDVECSEEANQSDSAILSDSERSNSKRLSPVELFSTSSKKAAESKQPYATGDLTIGVVAPAAPPTVGKKKSATNNKTRQHQQHATAGRKSPKNRKSKRRPRARDTSSGKPSDKGVNVDDEQLSLSRRIWIKIVRAFRTSLPLNIVLLVCLAGLCVVPMIQRDACCGMAQEQIASSGHDMKPV